jgi:hypothetical protein
MNYVDKDSTRLMLLFLSDPARLLLQHATQLHCHVTCDVTAAPFRQILVVFAQTADQSRPLPCLFGLLPDQEAETYARAMTVVKELVDFTPMRPLRIFLDFEQRTLWNVLCESFPWAKVRLG